MTTTPTLREAAQQFVQDYENGDLGDLKHYARSMRAALAAEQAEPSEHRPDREWYARMIRETAGDDFVAGPAFKLPEQAEQAEPVAQTSAEWERRFLAYDPKVDPAEAQCDIPPHGWRCTRAKGHDGPCAAVAAPDDVALVRRSMARLAAAEQAEPVAPYAWLQRGEFGGCTTERLFLVSEFPDMDRRAWIDSVTILPLYLAAPPAPARQEWRPIETAPKTGAKIIVRYVNRNNKPRTVMARWLTDEQAEETDADGVGLKGGWYECIDNWDDYTEVAIHEGEPSLWMPLPAAPITAAPAEGGAA